MNIEHKRIALDKITPDKNQPRKYLSSEFDSDLTESIKIHGLINPIEVEKVGSEYRIITGELRWRAAKKANLDSIDCHVIEGLTESERFLRQFSENVQRKDMSPNQITDGLVKLAKSLADLDRREPTNEDLARVINKSEAWVESYYLSRNLPLSMKKRLAGKPIQFFNTTTSVKRAEENGEVKKGTTDKFIRAIQKGDYQQKEVAQAVAHSIRSNPGLADKFLAVDVKGLDADEARQKLDKIAPSIRTQAMSYEFKAAKLRKLADELRERLEQWPSKDFGKQLPIVKHSLKTLTSRIEKW